MFGRAVFVAFGAIVASFMFLVVMMLVGLIVFMLTGHDILHMGLKS